MVKSMTGYGRSEVVNEMGKLIVEIKAVNHRYLDMNIKMPRQFNPMEHDIRLLLKTQIGRGKVDVCVTFETTKDSEASVVYNEHIASDYVKHLKQMQTTLGVKDDVTCMGIANLPDVFSLGSNEANEEILNEMLMNAVKASLEKFVQTRELEGSLLKKDLLSKLDYMMDIANRMEERYPQVLAEYRKRLLLKVKELLEGAPVDEARVATEVVLYADKICVDEELVRLKSHIAQTKEVLETLEQVGRKLDFLAQELNREANTMLSKTTDMMMTDLAIELKTEIEKIREQVQNLE